MSNNDHYKWLELQLRLHAASLTPKKPRDDDGGGAMSISSVYAQAGRFRDTPVNAVNDMTALLLALILIWWWNCAKRSATLANFGPDFCKINAGPNFGGLPRNPHQMGAAGLSPLSGPSDKTITSPHSFDQGAARGIQRWHRPCLHS